MLGPLNAPMPPCLIFNPPLGLDDMREGPLGSCYRSGPRWCAIDLALGAPDPPNDYSALGMPPLAPYILEGSFLTGEGLNNLPCFSPMISLAAPAVTSPSLGLLASNRT